MPNEKTDKTASKLSEAMKAVMPVCERVPKKPDSLPADYRKKAFMDKKKEIDLTTWTETELILLRRRSCRAFQKKQVPENLVRRILEAGRFAPSAGNNMHWRFMVVRDPQMLNEMSDSIRKAFGILGRSLDYYSKPSKKPIIKALQFLFPNMLHIIPHNVFLMLSKGNFDPFWGAPTLILLFKDVRGIGNPDLDLGMAGENMVIAAHSLGLGTCWIGLVKALRVYKKWQGLFEISYPFVLEVGIVVGYQLGETDGFINRETLGIKWFDTDGTKVVY